jgi:3-oxoadipate enol-lactonase
MMSDYSGWHWTHDDPEICLDPPAAQRLEEISLPVQIILGERDVSDFQTIAATLTAGISGAAKSVIPGVGHMSNMEAPTAFNGAVLDFLA